ncbi:hypothetical protein EC988_002623 [Linderina pennispora]|nr:hypothetical protein EC988_002623 [Linderina pennispora]
MKISFALLALATTAVFAAPTPDTYDKRAVVNFAALQQAAKSYSSQAIQIRNAIDQLQKTKNQISGSLSGKTKSDLNAAHYKAIGNLDAAAKAVSSMAGQINKLIASYQGAEGRNPGFFN